jgi:hypothetical protein
MRQAEPYWEPGGIYLMCAFSSQRIASRTNSAAVPSPSFSFARTQYAWTVFRLR